MDTQDAERSYHIFYQMMQKAIPSLQSKCNLSDDIYDYHFVSQGKTSVPSIDDNEDLEFTHEAFNILHFSESEIWNIYKCVSAVMNMGELVGSPHCPHLMVFIQQQGRLFFGRNSSRRAGRSSANRTTRPEQRRWRSW